MKEASKSAPKIKVAAAKNDAKIGARLGTGADDAHGLRAGWPVPRWYKTSNGSGAGAAWGCSFWERVASFEGGIEAGVQLTLWVVGEAGDCRVAGDAAAGGAAGAGPRGVVCEGLWAG